MTAAAYTSTRTFTTEAAGMVNLSSPPLVRTANSAGFTASGAAKLLCA